MQSKPGLFLRGLTMGAADLVPGVSGGTMALITGIYYRLLEAVATVTGLFVGIVRLDAARIRRAVSETNWGFVLPVLLGIATAIAIGATFLGSLIEDYPRQTSALFFGLIVASIPIPWKMIPRHSGSTATAVVLAAVFAFVITGFGENTIDDPAWWFVIVSAAIAICAMILPGISGSYLLLVMGTYAATLDALKELDLAYIALFALGAITGITLFSRLLNYLVHTHRALTMAVVTGFLIGALRALWPWQTDERVLQAPEGPTSELVAIVGLAVLGAAVVTAIVLVARERVEESYQADVPEKYDAG